MEIVAFFLVASIVIKFFSALGGSGSDYTPEAKSQEEIKADTDDFIEYIKGFGALIVLGLILCGLISMGKYALILIPIIVIGRICNKQKGIL